tara:strand:+ start:389 stop:694 length:306 start_codon:yes stop_codon:yes gene_type:complete
MENKTMTTYNEAGKNVMSFLYHRVGVRKVQYMRGGETCYRPVDDMAKFLLEFAQADSPLPDDTYDEDLSCNDQGMFSPYQMDLLKAYGFEPFIPATNEEVV